jgi:TetR/AcrR family transcriptional regulator, cholesterol catabolism regulator
MDLQEENINSDQKASITRKAEVVFFKNGIKSISMDEMSRELGVSKKTLYKYFENKDDLVNEVTKNHIEDERLQTEHIYTNSLDAIHELLLIDRFYKVQMEVVPTQLIFDLRRYHPDSWAMVDDFQKKYVEQTIFRNLEWGKKDGFYRKSIDSKLISKFYTAGQHSMFNDDTLFNLREMNLVTCSSSYTEYHLFGIMTDLGLEKYKEYLINLPEIPFNEKLNNCK